MLGKIVVDKRIEKKIDLDQETIEELLMKVSVAKLLREGIDINTTASAVQSMKNYYLLIGEVLNKMLEEARARNARKRDISFDVKYKGVVFDIVIGDDTYIKIGRTTDKEVSKVKRIEKEGKKVVYMEL